MPEQCEPHMQPHCDPQMHERNGRTNERIFSHLEKKSCVSNAREETQKIISMEGKS
jgi:hypothetical protein